MITGTSQELGKALAEEFAKRNYEVIAAARNAKDIQINGIYQKNALDISEPKMIDELVSDIGNIDKLVNNAGVSLSGPLETIPIADAKNMFDANFFGTLKMILQLCLPKYVAISMPDIFIRHISPGLFA